MPFRLGPWEIGLILIIVLVVFGAGKLPQIGGAIGRGLREFRKAQRGEDEGEKPKGKTYQKVEKGGLKSKGLL